MSHLTTINTQVRDLEALKEACTELGLPVEAQAEARGYGSQTRRGEVVIRIPSGPYDIALSIQPDRTYELATDWWGGHVEKAVGPNYGRLLQLYGVHKATREARRKGYLVRRRQRQDGTIKLTIGGV